MPGIDCADSEESMKLHEYSQTRIRKVFDDLLQAGVGRMLQITSDESHDHPGGGCRMGEDPATSVVESLGRSHDHENLFGVGSSDLSEQRLQQRNPHLCRPLDLLCHRDRQGLSPPPSSG